MILPDLSRKDRRRWAIQESRVLIAQTWESQLNLSLFLGLVVFTVFVMPVLGLERPSARFVRDVVFSVILISGVAIGWGERTLFVFSSFIAAVALIIRWSAWYIPTDTFSLWREASTLASIMLVCVILLSQILRAGNMTAARVQGAIAVYLLLGLAWAHGYEIVNRLIPDSFHTSVGSFSSVSEWYYYSYSTLTTLGYGDIVPIKQVSRSLATGEALTGQLYLTVLIARLVALEVMSWKPDSTDQAEK